MCEEKELYKSSQVREVYLRRDVWKNILTDVIELNESRPDRAVC